jgi:cell division protein FtsL
MQPALSALSQGASSTDVAFDYEQAAPAVRQRRIKGLTTFNIVLVLIVFAVLVVVYISSVVAVDGLMMEQIGLEREEQLLLQERETLRAEINMLSSYNRIQAMATQELGLVHANQQPYSLTVFGMAPTTAK